MRHNPLIPSVLHILGQADSCLSEYELMRRIELLDGSIDVVASSYQLTLFRKHFLVMNALYRVQSDLALDGIHLHISALSIALNPVVTDRENTGVSDCADVKLREYYLDWKNYDATGEEDVQRLLAGFWQRYAAVDKQQSALQALGLNADADWPMIQSGYRRLVNQYHPDKGGDESRFIEVREAYEILRYCYERT